MRPRITSTAGALAPPHTCTCVGTGEACVCVAAAGTEGRCTRTCALVAVPDAGALVVVGATSREGRVCTSTMSLCKPSSVESVYMLISPIPV